MVIFDSRVRVGEAQAVDVSGRAEEVSSAGMEQAVQIYSRALSCAGRPNGRLSACGRLRSTGSTVPRRPRSRFWTASGTAVPATSE
jgi:hypothetical protein